MSGTSFQLSEENIFLSTDRALGVYSENQDWAFVINFTTAKMLQGRDQLLLDFFVGHAERDGKSAIDEYYRGKFIEFAMESIISGSNLVDFINVEAYRKVSGHRYRQTEPDGCCGWIVIEQALDRQRKLISGAYSEVSRKLADEIQVKSPLKRPSDKDYSSLFMDRIRTSASHLLTVSTHGVDVSNRKIEEQAVNPENRVSGSQVSKRSEVLPVSSEIIDTRCESIVISQRLFSGFISFLETNVRSASLPSNIWF